MDSEWWSRKWTEGCKQSSRLVSAVDGHRRGDAMLALAYPVVVYFVTLRRLTVV